MIKIIIFDFDGTLVDSKKLYIETIRGSLIENYYVFPKSKIAQALGPKLEITLQNIKKFNPAITEKLKKDINVWIAKETASLNLCPYSKLVLEDLKKKGIILILMTNSARKYTYSFLKQHKVFHLFIKILCAEDFDYKKEAIDKIRKDFKVKKSEVVYVADKETDIAIAKKAGCKYIIVRACSWDKVLFKNRNDKFIIENLSYLKDALSIQ